ncbi:acid sphingomyelinase-like phosphodiesterase 3a isoform X2 [Hydractinia symbiolongicarpus]|uniref:acid sphingomyelinase-like phosphodiesterase 3a isoform X2 n=1 Tax=Hydractinia symbiolongicarpus TaxID=13093 RepID=UPI0025511E2E|nr:acid sphingomyelinase-like phosphodiesterase 3a isoform X2 [Hydractinia symbiolongicarpus]XP_057302791.1 acid sphingomyelinase-like phosphodiesterase 3a isoform X2 [Hydractinia symbiolongicarpus]
MTLGILSVYHVKYAPHDRRNEKKLAYHPDYQLKILMVAMVQLSPSVTLLHAENADRKEKDNNAIQQDQNCSSKFRVLIILLAVIVAMLAVSLAAVVFRCNKRFVGATRHRHTNIKYFFQISDTHLDIYYNANITNKKHGMCRDKPLKKENSTTYADNVATFGRVQCDSSTLLLQSLSNKLQNVNKKLDRSAEFVLITGDQSAHSYDYFQVNATESVLWSIGNSTVIIGDGLPTVPVFPLIGNNDLFIDYGPPPKNHSYLYEALGSVFEPYIFRGSVKKLNTRDEFLQTFEYGGYYKITIDDGHLVMVMLNSNYWSSRAYGVDPKITIIGDEQLLWLKKLLEDASHRKQKVVLAGHIPPGCSTYPGEKNMWLQNYTEAYLEFTTTLYPDVVTGQLFGHTHSDKVKLQNIKESRSDAFLLICPSITPNYQNNPAFRLYEYDVQHKQLQDYTQFHFDLTVSNVFQKSFWSKEYSFREEYGRQLTVNSMGFFIDDLLNASSSTWFKYSTHMKSQYDSILFTKRFAEYCGAKFTDVVSYEKCLQKYINIGV